MKHFFYSRLALSNIKKNAQIYFPYLLTSAFTVAMFYSIHSLSINAGLLKDSHTAPAVLTLGTWVVFIFSVVFLFYVNSFLIKRRKKEVALYNILGMEKKHVMIMMFCETLLTSLIAISGGIILGALFSKLMFLLLIKVSRLHTSIYFEVPIQTIQYTILFYSCIFLISYIFNVIQIKLANPIELLKGGQVGEKEPKTKWILTLFGLVTLGSGYYIAQTIENPTVALVLFFVAVVLVIIGTYCLFTAGSITLLKALKKNKRFYYQTRHFTSVSQMIYRMKQNAVGLASICILCTCILVMISSTITLYLGLQDTVKIIQDENYKVIVFSPKQSLPNRKQTDQLSNQIKDNLSKKNIELKQLTARVSYEVACLKQNNQYITGLGSDGYEYTSISAMTLDEYNLAYGKHETLQDNQVLFADNFKHIKDNLYLNQQTYQIKKTVQDQYFLPNENPQLDYWLGVVFKDENTLRKAILNENLIDMRPSLKISINYQKESDSVIGDDIIHQTVMQSKIFNEPNYIFASQYDSYITFTEAYGSLFFLGFFLGVLFLMAAIIIMYYKQLSEGYEDQKRFEIMQNVGMSKKEVKQTIKSQVLIFFFLPIVVAVIHMTFAYKMIVKMFSYLIMSGSNLFIICTVISVIVLLIIYSIIYSLTAKTYYKIVKN